GGALACGRVRAAVWRVVAAPRTIGTEPPEVLGAVSAGFLLSRTRVAELGALTQSDVALLFDDHVAASTLSPQQEAALDPRLQAIEPTVVRLGDTEYLALRRSLGAQGDGPAPVALILRSRTERLHFLKTFRAVLLVAALVAVAMAVILSYLVARTVTRPLADITDAMREMAATGDLGRKIVLSQHWDAEAAALLAGTFNTLTEAAQRFQREAALRERLSALGRLSTVIAHEVRNPLMIIKGSLRELRRAELHAAELREAVTDIDHEVVRLNRIVDDVLDFARPVRLEYAPADLPTLCRDAAAAAFSGHDAPRLALAADPAVGTTVTVAGRLRTRHRGGA